jgi:hypothetical protein
VTKVKHGIEVILAEPINQFGGCGRIAADIPGRAKHCDLTFLKDLDRGTELKGSPGEVSTLNLAQWIDVTASAYNGSIII